MLVHWFSYLFMFALFHLFIWLQQCSLLIILFSMLLLEIMKWRFKYSCLTIYERTVTKYTPKYLLVWFNFSWYLVGATAKNVSILAMMMLRHAAKSLHLWQIAAQYIFHLPLFSVENAFSTTQSSATFLR